MAQTKTKPVEVRDLAHGFVRTCLVRGYIATGKPWPLGTSYHITPQDLQSAFVECSIMSFPDLSPTWSVPDLSKIYHAVFMEMTGGDLTMDQETIKLPCLSKARAHFARKYPVEALDWATLTPPPPPIALPPSIPADVKAVTSNPPPPQPALISKPTKKLGRPPWVRDRLHIFARTTLERGYIAEGKPWPTDKTYEFTLCELKNAFQKENKDLTEEMVTNILHIHRAALWREFTGASTNEYKRVICRNSGISVPSLTEWRCAFALGNENAPRSWWLGPSQPVSAPLPCTSQKRKTIEECSPQKTLSTAMEQLPTQSIDKYQFYYLIIREMGCVIPTEDELNQAYVKWCQGHYQESLHREAVSHLFYFLPDHQWKNREISVIRAWIAGKLGIKEIPDKDWWCIVFAARPTLHMRSDQPEIVCCDDPLCERRVRLMPPTQ